jgi:homoserine O-acetyltransferase
VRMQRTKTMASKQTRKQATSPPADCQAEWRLIPDAEFRPIQTIDGHLALFGADPNAISQLDKHLGELLATKI